MAEAFVTAFIKNFEKGEKIGEARGIEKGKIEVAKKILADGMGVELASKYSGLSIEEIDKLKASSLKK